MSVQHHEKSLSRVIDVIRNDAPAALLIGAGCSVSAGIPSGNGFAQIIRNRYRSVDAEEYADCMSEIPKPQQKSIIEEKINEADVNWAHVAIAQLIEHGFVDRVLTTNFDPLVSRACALIGRFPAIYDYAAAPGTFNAGTVSDPSVFHLHGQGTGFVLKNSQSEMRELADALPDLLQDTLRDRPLVVVGYGGGDPVFDQLVAHGQFQHELYWITYDHADPDDHVKRRLLDGCNHTHFVRSSNADSFFIRLTRGLECFPPTYVEKPFSHQLELLDSLTDFPSLGEETIVRDGRRTRGAEAALLGLSASRSANGVHSDSRIAGY